VRRKKWNQSLSEFDLQEENVDPYTLFVYGIRSPNTKESYFRRLRGFFDAVNLDNGSTFKERCNTFVFKGRSDSRWAFNYIVRFLHYQKERVQTKEITAGTLHNYVKTLKMFREVMDEISQCVWRTYR
jgi:mannosyltransferase OCH1-like enzyme